MEAIELIKSILEAKKNVISMKTKSYSHQIDEFGTMSERIYTEYSFYITAKQNNFLVKLLSKDKAKINNTRVGNECYVNGYGFILSQQFNGSYLFSYTDLNNINLCNIN